MHDRNLVFWIVVLAVLGVLGVYRYVRTGSVTGALVGGKVLRIVGETSVDPSAVVSTWLRVQLVEPLSGREPMVVVNLLRTRSVAGGLVALRLTRMQASELAELLRTASGTR